MSIASKRITIVLGAGGPVGHAFHVGLLRGLSQGLGWDPRNAGLVVGTSAGAQVAALLRAGMTADDLSARVTGDEMSPAGASIAACFTRPTESIGNPPQRYRPSSFEYLKRVLRRPWLARPARLVSALLPHGRVCMKPQVEGLRRLFGHEWPQRPLWITAVCLHSGERLAFGRAGSPNTDVGTAVASSGAIPSVCIPPEVDGRRLIDGGMASPTHLDLLHDSDDDLVVVSSPLSMIPPMRWLLRAELWWLRRRGKRVVVFEPEGSAARLMGYNPMKASIAPEVARLAHGTVLRALERKELKQAFAAVV